MGHRPGVKGGYFPVPPVDSEQDMRAETLKAMKDMGVKVEKHHHEVAPSQHELGICLILWLPMQIICKFINTQLIWLLILLEKLQHLCQNQLKEIMVRVCTVINLFGKMESLCLPVISMQDYLKIVFITLVELLNMLKRLNAFTNATTNSYKRLIPGFEAPVLLAYSARNRSASCRIPLVLSPKGKRVEVRFPDAAGNPYLTFASMLMAGLDGIKNKIDPGKPFDKDLYA